MNALKNFVFYIYRRVLGANLEIAARPFIAEPHYYPDG